MDWTRPDRDDSFYGVLVDPFALDVEYGRVELGYGTVTLDTDYYSDEKISGTLRAGPGFPNLNNRFLRIYMESTLEGETVTQALGTFMMRRTGSETTDGGKERDIELHSTLWRHIRDTSWNYSLGEGEGALYWLREMIVNGHGTFRVSAGVTEKTFNETSVHVRKPILEVSNYCADFLGCGSCDVDPMGIVTVGRYLDPDRRPVVWTFEDGVNCIYEGDYIVDSDEDDIPNWVRVWNTKDDTVRYADRELPASSPYSVRSRGAVIPVNYIHDDLEGDIQAALERKVDEYYARILSMAISIEITHSFAPIRHGDAVRFRRGNTDIVCTVHAMSSVTETGYPTTTVLDVVGGALGDVYP